ncbi:MFS transporter [Acidithiobacillus thiooxidans]|uniref:MFS transporter n=1 Tax=Acidithiobacillus thiooxidans TaxID=930 RepID=UPI001C075367|nr:MFS transporter [Acidithiobacillus thiooxidans]MBU2750745.1 MFS transporter [Acidithiobacillus thiooxidans]
MGSEQTTSRLRNGLKEGFSKKTALNVHAFTLFTYVAASSAPTPLYSLYQSKWHFTPVMLTVIFSTYALFLLMALLVAGRLSDHLGRRPVIAFAILLQIVTMGIFLLAQNIGWLLAGRALQGIATGVAVSALGAALVDIHQERGSLTQSLVTLGGLAFGVFGVTVLVELAPAPLHLVFMILMAAFALQLVLSMMVPETAVRRSGAIRSLVPTIHVPRKAKGALLAIAPINVAVWALGGFSLSLMPSLIDVATQSRSMWYSGLDVAALNLSGCVAIWMMRRSKPVKPLIIGAALLIIGLLIILVVINAGREGNGFVALLAGTMVAGAGYGAGLIGSIRSIVHLVQPSERSGLMAAYYIESYLAFSLPTIIAGYIDQQVNLLSAANIYGSAIIILAFVGIALGILRSS